MPKPSLATTVAGIPLECCIYNASGPRTGTSTALAKVAASKAGAILTKSATVEAQKGNPQPRIWHDDQNRASMNSEGLPNNGIDYYIDSTTIQDTLDGCPSSKKKPYLVSISGKTLADNMTMLERIIKAYHQNKGVIASVELNLACPNVIGKPIIAYDFEQLRLILKTLAKQTFPFPLGIKMPPYLDGKHLAQAAAIVNEYSALVKYVTCINTIGNALSVDPISQAPSIASNGGLAGLSGPAVKYTALANVKQWRSHLNDSIDVVGVGGIESGTDALEMLLCGATAVQVGTCHWKEGPACFDRIANELQDVLVEKGYASVQEVIGNLQEWSKEGAALSRAAAKKNKNGTSAASSSTTVEHSNVIIAMLVVLVAILLGDKVGIYELDF